MQSLPAPLRDNTNDMELSAAGSAAPAGDSQSVGVSMEGSDQRFKSKRNVDQAYRDAADEFLEGIEDPALKDRAEDALELLVELHRDTGVLRKDLSEFNSRSSEGFGAKLAAMGGSLLRSTIRASGETLKQDGVTAGLNVLGDQVGGDVKAAAYPAGLASGALGMGLEAYEMHEDLKEEGLSAKTAESALGLGSLAALTTQKLMHERNFTVDAELLTNTEIPGAKTLAAVKRANAMLNEEFASQTATDAVVGAVGHGLQMLKRGVGAVRATGSIVTAGLAKQITDDDRHEISEEFSQEVKSGLTKSQVRNGIKGALELASLVAAGARMAGQIAQTVGTGAEVADYAVGDTDGADMIRKGADGITTNGEIPVIPVAVLHGLRNSYRPANSSGRMSYIVQPKQILASEKNSSLSIAQVNALYSKVSELTSDIESLKNTAKEADLLLGLLARAKDICSELYRDRRMTSSALKHRAIDDVRYLSRRTADLLGIAPKPDIEEGGDTGRPAGVAMFDQQVETVSETEGRRQRDIRF